MRRKKTLPHTCLADTWHFTIRHLFVLSIVAGVIVMAIYTKEKQFKTVLPIKNITVEGRLIHLDRSQLEASILHTVKGGYFTLDLNRIRKRLLVNPWIRRVSVRRHWPAQLIVTIAEKKPVAYWNHNAFISAEGDVFKPAPIDNTLLLPQMFGPQGQYKKVWMFMNKIYQPLASMALQVKVLSLDDRRAWKLVLTSLSDEKGYTKNKFEQNKNAVVVRLGRNDTQQRFDRFVRVFSSISSLDLRQIKSVDMRYPNGFAVLRKTVLNNKNRISMQNGFFHPAGLHQHNKKYIAMINDSFNTLLNSILPDSIQRV